MKRLLGIPWLFAVGYLAVGFSLYFSLGIVAERGLGLTPLIFLGAGLMFVLTTFTYTEGGAMYAERGGSNTFARHAFNELISFVAGWAVLIDYIIIVAIAAITVPHYLTPIAQEFGEAGGEIVVAAAVIVGVAVAQRDRVHGRAAGGALLRRHRARRLRAPGRRDRRRRRSSSSIPSCSPTSSTSSRSPTLSDAIYARGDRDGRARGHRGGVRPRARPRVGARATSGASSTSG